ncbi:MAG: phospho-N-acetylmuramoyl-pentapeptide-transferase [Oscillospiraceae bacterium]
MTVWIRIAVPLMAFALSALFGRWLVPFMHKISFGQPIKDIDGPSWHANKQGTPIMGGFMFMFGAIISTFIGYTVYRGIALDTTDIETSKNAGILLSCIIYGLLFSGIGFVDDYTKAVKKDNAGITAWQKMFFQAIFSGLFLFVLYIAGDTTTVNLIFTEIDLGIFYYPVMILFMIYMTNAVNLTDGVDGLCGSVTVVAMLAFTTAASILGKAEISLYAIALAGGCLGFLCWNLHPAKCFMGDTGSMFLGASVVAVGMAMHQHLLIIIVGIVYVLEAFSVVMQTTYFKITKYIHYKKTGEKGKGKRIFKMTPIHHHFEMSGFSEYKIVISFSLAGAIAGILGVLALNSAVK